MWASMALLGSSAGRAGVQMEQLDAAAQVDDVGLVGVGAPRGDVDAVAEVGQRPGLVEFDDVHAAGVAGARRGGGGGVHGHEQQPERHPRDPTAPVACPACPSPMRTWAAAIRPRVPIR
jgi:hypothetical protein